jgi:tetratricopeptide (TPR) repeat protein
MDPKSANALKDRGRAIQNYDQSIKLNPNSAPAFDSRGDAYHTKGDYDRAIQDYDRAIKLRPDHPDTGITMQKRDIAKQKKDAAASKTEQKQN